MTTDNNKEIEEIVDELINQIYDYEDTRGNVKIKITEALTSYADQRVKEERDRVLKILKEHDKSLESRVIEVVYHQDNENH